MDDRGRRPSSQGVHRSPQPSPHRYHDAQTGLEQPLNQNTFGIEGYSSTQSNNSSFGSPGNVQPYMNNFSLDQSAIMGNQYMAHGVDSSFGNEGYMLQANPYTGTFNQEYPLNQYQSNVNPADLNKISSPDMGSQALLSPENHNSPGPQSPTSTNGQFHTPQHSRNVSLDPNSTYNTGEWQGMTFRNPHHRSPSNVSDVSSVQNSPFVPHAELASSHSPLFGAQQDTSTFGLDSFTIGDQAHSQPGSNYVSPRLIPQQEGLGIGGDLMLNQGYMGQEVYSQEQSFQNMGALHNRQTSVVSDIGQADQFEPPTINIEPAPVSRQASFGPGTDAAGNSLYPPFNSGRGRNRSKSETISRPMSSRSPSPGPSSLSPGRSPSPGASISRASSPGVSEGRISRDRRASTSVINNNNREYILDLADPTRPNGSAGGNSTRVQKHPATFQCTLCPKRFTRAYNLRSHLRTHTDERPFVCTICGKAFARQHDRKRHEGLHSGEKKFVCKGELNSAPGQTWGCGRRFARADALGRHFRSEAGRVCIKPLLDEEAAERRQRAAMEQQSVMQQHQAVQNMLQPVPQQMNYIDPNTNAGFSLPAALLAQYPALQNLDWNAISAGGVSGDDMDGDLSDVGYDGSDVGGGGHLSDSGIPAYGGGQHNNSGW